jgi:hypothetical protein
MSMRGASLVVIALFSMPFAARADAPNRPTKAPPTLTKAKATTAPAPPAPVGLVIVETVKAPTVDYEAEVYSGVPLTDAYARDRGLSNGLVRMVFEKQRRTAFRIPHDKIKRVVRLAEASSADVAITKRGPFVPVVAARNVPRDRIDIIETDGGFIAIETATTNAGIFTTSDVYVFARGATFDQRIAALASLDAGSRERLRNALTLAK